MRYAGRAGEKLYSQSIAQDAELCYNRAVEGGFCMKRMIAVLFAVLLLFPLAVTAETKQAFPLFESSFLQGWLCRDWTKERFKQELHDMKAAGFRSLILQSAVDLTHTETDSAASALYPSSLASGSEQSRALEYALQAAAETGMQKSNVRSFVRTAAM